jgi:hypothetical protein
VPRRAFVGTNPTDEPLISGLPVTWPQSGPVMACMGVAILPSAVPLWESLHQLAAMDLPRRGGILRYRQILYHGPVKPISPRSLPIARLLFQ